MINYNYGDVIAYLGIGSAHPGGFTLTKRLLDREAIRSDMSVLEIGCGTGKTAAYLSKIYGCSVTAIEKHPLMLEKALRRFKLEKANVNLINANAEKLPFKDSSFDLVIVESVTVFTDLSKSIKEFSRVLKEEGVLLDIEMTAKKYLDYMQTSEYQLVYGIKKVPTELQWLDKYFSSGFDDVKVVYKGRITSAWENIDSIIDSEIYSSGPIDSVMYNILCRHLDMTKRYYSLVGFNVYRGKK